MTNFIVKSEFGHIMTNILKSVSVGERLSKIDLECEKEGCLVLGSQKWARETFKRVSVANYSRQQVLTSAHKYG